MVYIKVRVRGSSVRVRVTVRVRVSVIRDKEMGRNVGKVELMVVQEDTVHKNELGKGC